MLAILNNIYRLAAALIVAVACTSCFTGIEGTKRISLTRDDRKMLAATPEEEFVAGVTGTPLGTWHLGKEFIAADDRTLLVFDQEGMPADPAAAHIGGKLLRYRGTSSRLRPDGTNEAVIVLDDGTRVYRLNTGRPPQVADTALKSDMLPMLIDLDMVARVRGMITGKHLWTRTALWYDALGNRVEGRKYVPVTVTGVMPGDAVFPLRVTFDDGSGRDVSMLMNFGRLARESRSFPNLFMLSDLRAKYPSVSDANWELICRGRVTTGMTKEECRLALGTPSEVDAGRDYTSTLDLWHYPDGKILWFEDGLLTRVRQ